MRKKVGRSRGIEILPEKEKRGGGTGDTANRNAIDLIVVVLRVEVAIGVEVQTGGVRLLGVWSTRPIGAVLTLFVSIRGKAEKRSIFVLKSP